MGIHVDVSNAGRNAFRPNPYEFAEIMYNWNPRAHPDALVDIPASDGFAIAPAHLATNRSNRIDFPTIESRR